jgi:hypothetical protein
VGSNEETTEGGESIAVNSETIQDGASYKEVEVFLGIHEESI